MPPSSKNRTEHQQMTNYTGTSKADKIRGGKGDDFIVFSRSNDTISGGDGFDVISYDGSPIAIVANFKLGSVSVGSKTDTIRDVEMIVGTAANDKFVGADTGESWFQGGKGNDRMTGGKGFDWADYYGSYGGMTVDLKSGTTSGYDGKDTLINIDNIRGSRYDDHLFGDDNGNRIRGMKGDDVIDGRGGNDLADYRNADGAVVVNLKTGIATGADGRDKLINIEGVRGTYYNDVLIGNDRDNFFETFSGNDRVTGGAGADTFSFSAGCGHDTITDFQATGARHDMIDVSGLASIISYKDLMKNHASQSGHDVVIDAGLDEIILKDVSIGDLRASDFLF
jgi:Ca2+-binding RTX toxin-like protein